VSPYSGGLLGWKLFFRVVNLSSSSSALFMMSILDIFSPILSVSWLTSPPPSVLVNWLCRSLDILVLFRGWIPAFGILTCSL